MTAILGISAYYHDSAAALLVDGNVISAAQEERFSRRKHDPSFPSHAIRSCLDQAGLRISDLDAVTYYEKPLLTFERLLETYIGASPRGGRSFVAAMQTWLKEKLSWSSSQDFGTKLVVSSFLIEWIKDDTVLIFGQNFEHLLSNSSLIDIDKM